MVQDVHPVGIEKDAIFDVSDERVVGPAVPQAGYHVIELPGLAVSFGMFDMLFEAEIEGRLGIGCGDEIPAGTAIADMVQRGELSGDMIGIVECGRCGGDQTQMLRDHGQRGEKGEGGRRMLLSRCA